MMQESLLQKIERLFGSAVRFLVKRWYMVVLSGLLCGLMGIAYAWLTAPKYIARLTFSLDEDNSIASNFGGLAASFGIDLGTPGGVFAGENIIELVKSRRIIERALLSPTTLNNQTTTLVEYYLQTKPNTSPDKRPSFPLSQPRNTYSRAQDSLLGVIYKSMIEGELYVGKVDRKLSIIEVNCTSGDEKFSKEFCEQLMAEVSKFYLESKTKRSRQNVELLQKKADSLRGALYGSISSRAAISDANLNPGLQAPVAGVQRKQTDIALLSAAYGELLKNLEVSKYTLLKETPLIQIIDEPIYPLKKKKPGRLISGIIGAMLGGALALLVLYVSFLFSNRTAPNKPTERVEI
jgi:uncharacterized protein involved in exopolysaccharide biosynthesis